MASICTLIRIFLREAYVCLLHPNWHHAGFCRSERRLGRPGPPRSPIIGPRRSLRCAAADSSTCTHTSTSARFHLLRQMQADGGKTQIPQTHKQKNPHLYVESSTPPRSSPVTGCGSGSHTSIKRIFTFIPLQKTLGVIKMGKKKKFLLFFFAVLLQEFLCL